jgi:hypothetical protein
MGNLAKNESEEWTQALYSLAEKIRSESASSAVESSSKVLIVDYFHFADFDIIRHCRMLSISYH